MSSTGADRPPQAATLVAKREESSGVCFWDGDGSSMSHTESPRKLPRGAWHPSTAGGCSGLPLCPFPLACFGLIPFQEWYSPLIVPHHHPLGSKDETGAVFKNSQQMEMGGGPAPQRCPERAASISAVRQETDLFNGALPLGHPWERFEGSPQSATSSAKMTCPAPGVGWHRRALPFTKPHAWLASRQALSSGALAHVDARGRRACVYFPPHLFESLLGGGERAAFTGWVSY